MSATDPISPYVAIGVQAGSALSNLGSYAANAKQFAYQEAGSVGAALGFTVFGPVGAAIGGAIGTTVGALADGLNSLFGGSQWCASLTIPDDTGRQWNCDTAANYLRWFTPTGVERMATPDEYGARMRNAIAWVIANPMNTAVAAKMSLDTFAENSDILPRSFKSNIVPVSVPGADAILQPLQAAIAAATLSAVPTMLPIWRVTIGSSFPALTDDQKNQVIAAVQPFHDAHVSIAQAWAHSQLSRPTIKQLNDLFALLPIDAQPIVDGWSFNIGGQLQAPTGGVFSPTPVDQQPTKPANLAKVATVGVVGVAGVSILVVLWHMLHTSMGFVSSAKSVYTHAKSFFTKKPKLKRKR